MAFLKGMFSRPTEQEQQAVNQAAKNQQRSGEEVGFATVAGTDRLVSYRPGFGGIVHDKWMMPVTTKKERQGTD